MAIFRIPRMGWLPDLPDQRDIPYTAPRIALPPSVDLRAQCPPVQDQGELGSCTAFAVGSADWFVRLKEGLPDFQPSELFLYWDERRYQNTVEEDSGAQVRLGLRSLAWHGACPSDLWPYDIRKFAKKPPDKAWTTALEHKLVSYQRLNHTSLTDLKACLASGYPFVSGFVVYESFLRESTTRTGIVQMPKFFEAVVGGHAVMTVGYDDASGRFLVRNSWGEAWGDGGYCTIPYAYWQRPTLAGDFWTLRTAE